jgi:hypothetical protein
MGVGNVLVLGSFVNFVLKKLFRGTQGILMFWKDNPSFPVGTDHIENLEWQQGDRRLLQNSSPPSAR